MVLFFTILVGVLILGLLVFVHEAAHFITAKLFNVRIDEFGFGFPPRVWGKKKGETTYTINAIPAGGFVRLHGEEGTDEKDPRSFSSKNPWQRSTIIAAGAIVNLLVAALLFYLVLGLGGFRAYFPNILPSDRALSLTLPFGNKVSSVKIVEVAKGSPAAKAGVKKLDDIVSADGQKFTTIEQFQKFIDTKKGKPVTLELVNLADLNKRQVILTPRENPPGDEGAVGVALATLDDTIVTVDYSSPVNMLLSGPGHAVNNIYFQGVALVSLVTQSFEEGTAEPVAENVAGPIGIVAILGFVAAETGISILAILSLVATISLILGVINLLPIPAVDGGRLFFTLFEGVTGKKVNPNAERLIHTAGFAVLIVLFFVITFNDISRLFH